MQPPRFHAPETRARRRLKQVVRRCDRQVTAPPASSRRTACPTSSATTGCSAGPGSGARSAAATRTRWANDAPERASARSTSWSTGCTIISSSRAPRSAHVSPPSNFKAMRDEGLTRLAGYVAMAQCVVRKLRVSGCEHASHRGGNGRLSRGFGLRWANPASVAQWEQGVTAGRSSSSALGSILKDW